jgi:cytochrome c-type biogenesis protein CcmH/NrfG
MFQKPAHELRSPDCPRASDTFAARKCILLEVLQRKKVVTRKCAMFTSFSTEAVERTDTMIFATSRLLPANESATLSGNPGKTGREHCFFRQVLLRFLLVPIANQLKSFLQHRTWPRAVGFANQPFAFHLIEHSGSAAIANAQTALQD